jgi:hypothetical protein
METRAQRQAGLWYPWRCETAVSVVSTKATTAAIVYELHPIDLEVFCSILGLQYGVADSLIILN